MKANVTLSHPYCVPDSLLLTDAPDSIMRQTMLEGSGLILTSWVSATGTYIKVHRLPPPTRNVAEVEPAALYTATP